MAVQYRVALRALPLLVLPLTFGPRRVSAQSASPAKRLCYELTYTDTAETPFARFIAIEQDADHAVESGTTLRTDSQFWRMFLLGATWEERGDTLAIQFSNGFSGVAYTLVGRHAGDLRGTVQFQSDVIGTPAPLVPVHASRMACERANLQTPLALDRRFRDSRRQELRRRRIVESETARLAARPSPLAGTYRFELRVPGYPSSIILYGRTDLRPGDAFWQLTGYEQGPPRTGSFTPAIGSALRIAVTLDSAALPLSFTESDEGDAAVAYFSVLARPSKSTPDHQVWNGVTDVLFAASRLTSTEPLDSILTRASEAVSAVWYDGEPGRTTATWTTGAGDRVDFAMRVERRGRTVLTVRGHRLDRTTLEPRP